MRQRIPRWAASKVVLMKQDLSDYPKPWRVTNISAISADIVDANGATVQRIRASTNQLNASPDEIAAMLCERANAVESSLTDR